MPLTPLFPEVGPITFQQGDTGDCYLLASLDCILQTAEGLERIKSMFRPVVDGVELRIKRCEESRHLYRRIREGVLGEKYVPYYDDKTDEDVFVIGNGRLSEIDTTSAVRSNSLALKIFERALSYYYVADWSSAAPAAGAGSAFDPTGSIAAHNVHGRHETSGTTFMGNVLGIPTQELSMADVEQIIQLKRLRPDYPVYLGMEDSRARGRHGFRLERIIENGAGGYDFILVNPWDNTKREHYHQTDIERRTPRFAIHHTPLLGLKKELQAAIISNPFLLKELISKPELLTMIINIAKVPTDLTLKDVQNCVYIYRKVPTLPRQFIESTPPQQREMIGIIKTYDGDVSYFTSPTTRMAAGGAGAGAGAGAGVSAGDTTRLISLEERITSAARTRLGRSTTETLDQSRTKIIHSIATYYFDPNPGRLTRESDLRALFSNPHFRGHIPTDTIPSNIPEDNLIIAAIELLTIDKARRYLEASRFTIPLGFVDKLIVALSIKEPRPLFNQIFQLSLINPRLANELFQSSKAKLTSLFPGEHFNNLKGAIIREADSPFKRWFLSQEEVVPARPTPVVAPAVTAAPPIAPIPPLAAARPPVAPLATAAGVGTTTAPTTPPAAIKKEHYKRAITPLLEAIEQKIALLRKKGDHAADAAFTTMVQQIKNAQIQFERSDSSAIAQAEATFIQQCSFAISNALPVLENRGAQRIFVPIVEALLSLATLLRIITPEVKKQSLFQIKTNSAQRALELKEALLRINKGEEENPTARQTPN